MTNEQIAEQFMKNNIELAELRASDKSAHKRIDENDRMIEGVHKLATSVETLAMQVKFLTDRLDATIARIETDAEKRDERVEASLKSQGERIGAVEMAVLTIERNEREISKNSQRIETIEKEPAHKWKDLVKQIVALVVAAVVGAVTGKFTQ